MKVSELIEQLRQRDPDAMIVIRGYEGGVNEAYKLIDCKVGLNYNDEWYYGKHEVINPRDQEDIYKNYKITNAVQISS